jgi:hypothetical protein
MTTQARANKRRELHGETNISKLDKRKPSSEYAVWCHIKARCYNPNHVAYAHYGGRGIKVCKRWRDSFKAFLADMGRRPSSKHSIDRIDNDGDYKPDNCRWATPWQQQNNKRGSQLGIRRVNSQSPRGKTRYVAQLTVNKRYMYLGIFPTIEEAQAARRAAEGVHCAWHR